VAAEAEKLVEGTMRKIAAILLYAGYILVLSFIIALLFAFIIDEMPALRIPLYIVNPLVGGINGMVSYHHVYKRLVKNG
jgi:hypothetical protein